MDYKLICGANWCAFIQKSKNSNYKTKKLLREVFLKPPVKSDRSFCARTSGPLEQGIRAVGGSLGGFSWSTWGVRSEGPLKGVLGFFGDPLRGSTRGVHSESPTARMPCSSGPNVLAQNDRSFLTEAFKNTSLINQINLFYCKTEMQFIFFELNL